MSAIAELEGKSLEDIIKSNKQVRGPKKPQQKGPERRRQKERDSPYSSSSPSNGKWKHDKRPETERRVKPVKEPAPQKSEEELGYKVKVSNSPLTEDEYKALLEGSEVKYMRVFAEKKFASIFFAKKEDAEKAIADYNNTELLDGAGNSVWEYVPWAPREPRPPREPREAREPRERQDSRPRQHHNKQHNNPRRGGAPTGGRINPHDVVITVRK